MQLKRYKYFARAVDSRLYLSCLVPPKLSMLWSQQKLYFVVIFHFFSQFKYLSNELEQFYSSSSLSSEKTFFRVQNRVRQNDLSSSSSKPWS